HHEQIASALPLVLVIDAGGSPRRGGHRQSDLADQLLARLVQTNYRMSGVVGELVHLKHVLHVPDEVGVGLGGKAPRPYDPGLDVVFLSASRTVSRATFGKQPKAISLSASNCKVQQQRPSGGSLQASRIRCCSTSPWILTLSGRGGRGRGWMADSKLSVTNR